MVRMRYVTTVQEWDCYWKAVIMSLDSSKGRQAFPILDGEDGETTDPVAPGASAADSVEPLGFQRFKFSPEDG